MRTIQFKTSYEDLISRLPGLFPYVEIDYKGNAVVHKATDSPMGCYGKIVENISIPKDCTLTVNETNIIEGDKTYTYKTLLDIYYKYIDDYSNVKNFEKFKEFFEKGIGKITVDFDNLKLNKKDNDLVPNFIYLVNARSLYDDMLVLKTKCDFYNEHKTTKNKEIDKETEVDLCCVCVLYERKGGDAFLEFLKEKVEECKTMAEDWFNNQNDEKNGRKSTLHINYSLNLFSTEKDMGIVTPLNNNEVIGEEMGKFTLNRVETTDITTELITFHTNSKLKSLRRFKTYINQYDEEERPYIDKDWLFYYRVGQICNISILNDENGNIATFQTSIDDIKKDDVVTDLMAYGDVIESIERDTEEKSIVFNYCTDVHLVAQCNSVFYDEDKNKKVTYGAFQVDKNYDAHVANPNNFKEYDKGVEYVETYYYDEYSELNDLSDDDFNNYIAGKNDGEGISGYDYKPFEKYEFSLYDNTVTNKKTIGKKSIQYDTVMSNNTTINIHRDINKNEKHQDIIRLDFYNGISYSPTEKFDVNVDRGTTSIFDRHIRLSEVKTLQDMEEFTNGSFFTIQE